MAFVFEDQSPQKSERYTFEDEKPSYWEAVKTGFREGLAGAARLYEIPAKLMYPEKEYGKVHLSHLLEPSEEEVRRTQELGIPGQVVRGAAGIPGAMLKYGPLTHFLGPMAGFAIPEAAETLAEGKPLPEVAKRTAEGLALGAGFKFLPPSLRYRVPGMATLFGGQALYETGEPREAIAPAIVGAGMGLMGGRGRRPIPRPEGEPTLTEPLRIPYKPSQLPAPIDTRGFTFRDVPPSEPSTYDLFPGPEGRYELPGRESLALTGREIPLGLPPGGRFTMEKPLPRTTLRQPFPKGYEVKFTPEGEPIYPPEVPRLAPMTPQGLPLDVRFKAPHVNEIFELRDMVARGEPGKKMGAEGRETISWGSSYPPFMRDQGWTKVEVLKAVDNGLAGRKGLGKRQQRIWDAINEEGKGIYNDRLEEQKKFEERKVLLDKDPDFLKPETIDDLTKNLDNEIIGLKEEWREQGYPESEINGLVEQAYETAKTEGIPTEVEGIKEILTKPTEELAPTPAPSPTRKGETLLPGMKVGLEMPSKGIEKPPTLEGTPLMEAARKAEIERVQPTLPVKPKEGILQELVRKDMEEVAKGPEEIMPILGKKLSEISVPTPKLDLTARQVERLKAEFKLKGKDLTNKVIELARRADKAELTEEEEKVVSRLEEGKNPVNFMDIGKKLRESEAKFATGERPVAPLTPEAFQRVSDTYSKENSPEKRIVDNPWDIPERILRQIPFDQRANIKGVYDPAERLTYLVRENIGSEAELKDIIDHEDIKHYAVDTFLGKEANNWFNRVYLKYGRSGLADIAKERGLDLNTQEGRIEVAREKIARTPIDEPGVIKQFWGWLREKLSKIFPDMKISDAEIQRTFKRVQEAMERGEFRERDERIEVLRKQVRNIQAVYTQRAQFGTSPTEIGKKFLDEDAIPKAAQIKEGARETWKSILNFIVPRSGVSRDILDKIMEKKGAQERAISEFILEKSNKEMKTKFSKMNQEDLTQFIDNIKTGQSQITPELNQMASFVKDLDSTIGEKYRAYRPDMNWLQDHFRVLWQTLPRGSEKLITELQGEIRDLRSQSETATRTERIGALEAQIDWIRNGVGEGTEGWRNWWSRRPLEGSRGYFKQHTLEDMSEGIRFGGVPYSYNPMEMLEMHYGDALKFITSQEMWKGLKEIGARKFVRTGERPPEGFVRLNDRIARVYFPAKERPVDLKIKTGEINLSVERVGRDIGMVQAGEWYVEEGAGRLLNNYLSRDLIREHPLGRTMMGFKNMTTAMELSLSPFHLMFETIETVASQAGLGIRKIWNQGLVSEGLKDIITAPKAFYDIAKTGGAAIKFISNPEEFLNTTKGRDFIRKFPGASELIADLFVGGGKLGMHEDYRIRAIETLKQNMNSKNYIGAALRSIPALNEMMMKPLFETYIPRLKIGLFLKEYSNELIAREADLSSGRLTRPELARNIWDFVENRLGEMNFDNLFWDRTFKSSLQFLVRSVTWKLGNIRSYGRAITGQSGELMSALREGRMPKLTQEMAWAWGVMATTAALASIVQYAYTGKQPEEAKDLVYPKIDEEGNRISLPTYMRDLFHVTHAPGKYVWSSLSGWIGRMADVVQNRDFYGAQIHDPEQNVISQRIDDLIHLTPLPFSFQTFARMREKGEPLEKAVTGFLGATKAPYWIEKTEAQQLATELAGAKIPAGGMTRAERARTDLIKNYAREYQKAQRKGESVDDILSKVQGDLQTGKLTQRDLSRFRQRIIHEPLEQSVLRLSLKEALRVWEKATPGEKIKIAPYVLRKFRTTQSPEEKEAALPKVQEIAGGMR